MAKYYEIPVKLIEGMGTSMSPLRAPQIVSTSRVLLEFNMRILRVAVGDLSCLTSPAFFVAQRGETIAHMRQPGNGRITILFNAFEEPRESSPCTVYEFGMPKYNEYIPPSNRKASSRAIIIIDVHKVGTSCDFGVPFYKFETQRTILE
ncbi:hypothetical protein DFH29DRAFT_1074515, partial [Suillus ampliporus]